MEVAIREIAVEDGEAVNNLSGQLGYLLTPLEASENIKAVIASSDNCTFVALENEKIIGWIHGFKATRIGTKPFIEIGGLVVDEKYRGKGVGKILIEKVIEWCIVQNIDSLRVRCNTKREQAHKFYLKQGFNNTKEQKVFEMNVSSSPRTRLSL